MAPPNPSGRRRRVLTRYALASLLVLAAVGGTVGVASAVTATHVGASTSADAGEATTAAVVAVYPNPVRDGDAGEYVLLSLPHRGNWTLSDGEATVAVRNRSGRVAVTPDPSLVADRVDAGDLSGSGDVAVVRSSLGLSNAGERLTLRENGSVVHRMGYGDAPEGERYVVASRSWRPVGFEPRDPVGTGPANGTAFVLPDGPDVPVATLAAADDRILLAGYTFASDRVADVLVAATRRNVTVRVLVEAHPVGGVSRLQAHLLDRLAGAGVEVRVVGASPSRFAFHHPKYAVVDDRALVMTENWKPAGTGGHSSRGWGIRLADADLAAELAAVFDHDARGPDTRAWRTYRLGRRFEPIPPANGSYPARHDPESIHARNVTVLTAPGNAASALVARIDDADTRVDVIQPTLGAQENALLRATLRAARRGVEVRILLSGAWYVSEENRRLVRWLNDWADRADAPLSARIADPGGRYEKIHAKGLLLDDDVAVVGSLNWNRNSARENREVVVALRSRDAVDYYRGIFEADWRGGTRRRPELFAGGAVAAVLLAGLVARRTVRFAPVERR